MKFYISGKITGLDIKEAERLFEDGEKAILYTGGIPVNPMKEVPYVTGKTWQQYMLEDIALIFDCYGMYMLSNWEESKGARIEHAIAKELGMHIIYQSNLANPK